MTYLLGTILGVYDPLRLGRANYHPLWSLTPFQGKKRIGAPNSLTWSTWSSIPDLNLAMTYNCLARGFIREMSGFADVRLSV